MTFTFCLLLAAGVANAFPEIDHYEPQPGDLILFQGKGIVNVIFALGHSGGATHSGIVVARPDGTLGLLESAGVQYPVMISDIDSRHQQYSGRIWVRRRCVPLTPEQSKRLTEFACAQEGKPYDLLGVFIPPFGHPVRKHRLKCLTDEQLLNRPRWFCSELCMVALIEAGILDRCVVRPRMTDPRDLKTDRRLDLTECGWEPPLRWKHCGEYTKHWFSVSCCGKVEYWK